MGHRREHLNSERVAGATLLGWRGKVGDAVGPRLSRWTPLRADQARSLIGVTFVALAGSYVVRSLIRLVRTATTA